MSYKIYASLFMLISKIYAQTDTVFYDANNDKVASLSLAATYETVTRSAATPNEELRKKFTKTGQQIAEDYYHINNGPRPPEISSKTRTGQSRMWYNNGKLKREIVYKGDKINGSCKTYWENGQVKRDDVFEKGIFISGKCYTLQGEDTTHYNFETMPEFKGGAKEMMLYIQKNLKYPEKSKEADIQGKVFIKFVIETDGSITNVTVLKGVNEELDNEAVRMIKSMPKWNPAKDDGTPVRTYFNVPLIFRLQ